VCIDNASDTSLMTLSRTFPCHHREMASEGSATTIRMAEGAACIDNASDTSSMTLSRTFPAITGKWPPRGLHSHHTGSHYIDDPQTSDHIYNKTISDSTIRYVNAQIT
jgi:hypothetical protein